MIDTGNMQLISTRHGEAGGRIQSAHRYLGNDAATGALQLTSTYTYEASGPLDVLSHKRPNTTSPDIKFEYDYYGDTGLVQTMEYTESDDPTIEEFYLYDATGQLTAAANDSMSYTAGGNPVLGTVVGKANRLYSMQVAGADNRYSVFTYDGEGTRIEMTVASMAAVADSELADADTSFTQSNGDWLEGGPNTNTVGNNYSQISSVGGLFGSATWTFTNLAEGTYHVYANVPLPSDANTHLAEYTFYDAANAKRDIPGDDDDVLTVSQQTAGAKVTPSPADDNTLIYWTDLGTFTIDDGKLTVQVQNAVDLAALNKRLVADAVYLEREGTETSVYTYDHRNRLTSVTIYDGTVDESNKTKAVDFVYDPFDQRIRKTVDGASEYYFVRDGHEKLIFDDDELKNVRLHGPAVDQILADEAHYIDELDNPQTAVVWPVADRLGSVRKLVISEDAADTAPAEIDHHDYNAFGKITHNAWDDQAAEDWITEPSYAFTGRWFDSETGLQYHRSRYYDPEAQRWISEDPSGLRGGDPNFYRYVNNNPTNATDPSGRIADWLLNAAYDGDHIYGVVPTDGNIGWFYEDLMAGGIRNTLGDEYLARASAGELVGLTVAGATAGVVGGWAFAPTAGATGFAAFGSAVASGAAAGGAEYLGMTLTAATFNHAYGHGTNVGPTLGGFTAATVGGAIGGGVFHVGIVGTATAGRAIGRTAGALMRQADDMMDQTAVRIVDGLMRNLAFAEAHVGTTGGAIARTAGNPASSAINIPIRLTGPIGGHFGSNLTFAVGKGKNGSKTGRVSENTTTPSEASKVSLTIKEPGIVNYPNLSAAERAFFQKHLRIKRNAIRRAAKKGELKWSPGTDRIRISDLQATHRARVAQRFERMFGQKLDMTTLNADHPVDLILGGSAKQRLRMLNESINKSLGASLFQAGRKAHLRAGQQISEVVFQAR